MHRRTSNTAWMTIICLMVGICALAGVFTAINVLILDNDTVGMTGTQRSMSTGSTHDQIIVVVGGQLLDQRRMSLARRCRVRRKRLAKRLYGSRITTRRL